MKRLYLPLVWLITLAVSVATMLFHRSDEPHGPDMVGTEVSAFMLPLLIAFVMSIVVTLSHYPRTSLLLRFAPVVTIGIGIAEALVYCGFIMR